MPLVTPGTFTMAALTSEITNDPLGLGYGSVGGQNPQATADLLNTSPEPIAAGSQEQIFRSRTETHLVVAGIDRAEHAALTQGARDYLSVIFANNYVATGNANLRTQVSQAYPAAGPSRAAMSAAAQKNASRAEALWGDGFLVTAQQVYQALGRE